MKRYSLEEARREAERLAKRECLTHETCETCTINNIVDKRIPCGDWVRENPIETLEGFLHTSCRIEFDNMDEVIEI